MKKVFAVLFTICCMNIFAGDLHEGLKERIRRGPAEWALEQIDEDLSSLTSADLSTDVLDRAMAENSFGDLLLARYVISSGHLYLHSTSMGEWGEDCLQLLNRSLTELVKACYGDLTLPDCDFIISLHDSFSKAEELNTAIFSFAKNKNSKKVVLFPDTDVLSSAEVLQVQTADGNDKFPWLAKENKAFWRGVTTGGYFTLENYLEFPRFQLVEISLKFPDLVDARFVGFYQGAECFKDSIQHYKGSSHVISDHLKYKYQILVDGNSCAFSRAYWQLFSNSLILKSDSENIQWYYKGIKPYVHFVPLASDFSDLINVVAWAKANDSIAFQINQNAQQFAYSNLLREDFYYYIYLLLNKYSKLQNLR